MITQITLSESHALWNSISSQDASCAPFNLWQWHNNWQETFGQAYQPLYLLIDQSFIAPLVIRGQTVIFSGGEEIADYLDIIGPSDAKEQIWMEIIEYLKQSGVRSLSLRNIPQNSPTIKYFNNIPQAIVQKEDTTPILTLASSWHTHVESIASSKHRHELERKIRQFEREHIPLRVNESAHPEKDIQILLDLMKKNSNKKTFLTPTMEHFFQQTANTFTKNVSLLLLTINDTFASATISFTVNGAYYLYNSGFDKECCPNAGFYLKAMSIKHAIDKGYTTYNFLQGNERYKYELGGQDFFVYSVTIPHL